MTDGQAAGGAESDPVGGSGVATDCWPELPAPPPGAGLRPTAPAVEWQRVGRGPKRRTRWDRPPPPKDWRFYVGWVGRSLIILGLLMFLFVGYQLWGTGIETARAQNELEDKWNELRERLQVEDDASPLTVAPPGSTPDAAPPPETLAPVTVPGSTTPSGAPVTLPPATVPPQTGPTTPAGAPVNLPPPERKVPLGYIAIPRIGVGYFFVPGVSRNDLKGGPGHFDDTVIPGSLGNAAIAGHRTTYGAPFGRLDELAVGDDIEIELLDGSAYRYVVTGTEVVEPSEYHVISNSDPTRATLTLVTCTPKATSTHRLIVHAELDPSRSAPVRPPTYYVLDDVPTEPVLPGDAPAADDPTMVRPTDAPVATPAATTPTTGATAGTAPTGTAPATAPDAGAAPVATGPEADPTTTTEAAAVPADPPTLSDRDGDGGGGFVSAPVAERGDDVFSEGWFADSAAWPHIVAWGLALIAIATGGWWVARFWKREWVGVLVAFAPFLFCLYFFFQNVNRLLPAGL